jgi:threonine dehydrogenase-like Zn-dependent dehydrogenase
MKAVTWQGFRSVSVDEVEDPIIKESNDAIIKVTSTNICGSDLHLYETMGAFMSSGDVLGMRRSASCSRSGATSPSSGPVIVS